MVKKRIHIQDCCEGDVLAEEVVNRYGASVVIENTVINDYIKGKLLDMGTTHVWVYETKREVIKVSESKSFEEFEKSYFENILSIKDVLNDLALGKRLDVGRIDSLSDSLYSEINNNCYIVKCLNKVKSADEYTYIHSVNVSLYSMLIGKWMRLQPKQIKDVLQAGLLHDIGKAKVPPEILNKPSRLLPEEFEEIKKHTVYGYEMVKSVEDLSEDVQKTVLMHHEREDNSGYPMGIKGDKMNIHSKIVAVADVFDAITSDRVYKKKATPFEAFQMFETSGLGIFDTKITWTLMANLSANYTGAKVKLDTGAVGKVVYIPPHNITKPIVNVESKYIDLSQNSGIKIVSML